jgi:hypothetical protein
MKNAKYDLSPYRGTSAPAEADVIHDDHLISPVDTVETVDQIMDFVKKKSGGGESRVCQNCGRIWDEVLLVTPVTDIDQRVSPGEPMPSGECVACGALCQQIPGSKSSGSGGRL